ncbi:MAG: GIY-YIG nuclease family protein [Candidatus Omnitrophica bacterium]|nr:GIY-YIG nuclease family protein [Candidatus Omnitrophota bacterium]
MPCTYILYSKSRGVFYKGSSREDTADLRFEAHNYSRVRSTKSGVPWELVCVEYYESYDLARRREMFLKTGVGRKWILENFSDLRRGGRVVEGARLESV